GRAARGRPAGRELTRSRCSEPVRRGTAQPRDGRPPPAERTPGAPAARAGCGRPPSRPADEPADERDELVGPLEQAHVAAVDLDVLRARDPGGELAGV